MNKKNTLSGINLVQEFREQFIKEILPDVLYHYTSIEGFKGIIDSKEIWATVADYLLNDPTEITIAKTIALEILGEREKDFNGKEDLYDSCKESVENSDRSKGFQCICSFSEKEDLLSQWRAYCPKGGISLGFNMLKHEQLLYKCIYNTEEQKQKMQDLFDFLLKRTETIEILKPFFGKMIQTFSYSFKHKSFEEEKEWRLCSFYNPDIVQLKYRTKNSMLIPCLPFSIVDDNCRSIITRIIIGPSRDKEKLKNSILSYLKDSGAPLSPQNIEVTRTPYQNL